MAIGSVSVGSREPTIRWALWPLWILASTLGAALAVVVVFGAIAAAKRAFGPFNEDDMSGVFLVLAMAACIGGAQWLVLRGKLPSTYWWPLATIAGCLIAYLAVMSMGAATQADLPSIAPDFPALTALALVGLSTGLCQWLYLRGVVKRSGWWVLACTVSWALLGLGVRGSVGSLEAVTLGLGLAPAVIPGGVLAWLLRLPIR